MVMSVSHRANGPDGRSSNNLHEPGQRLHGRFHSRCHNKTLCFLLFFSSFLNFSSFQPKKEENIFKKKQKTKSNKIAEEFVWVRRRSRDNGAGSVSFLSYRTSPVYRLERELASCCVRALWRHVGGWAYESNDDTRKEMKGRNDKQ